MFSFLQAKILLALAGQVSGPAGKSMEEVLPGWPPEAAQSPMIFRVISALFLVIVLIIIIAYLARRYLNVGRPVNHKRQLRVIESLPLGGKRMVQLIKVCDRTLVVGVTSNKIDLLTELSEEEIPFQEQAPNKGKAGFGEVLNFWPRKKAVRENPASAKLKKAVADGVIAELEEEEILSQSSQGTQRKKG